MASTSGLFSAPLISPSPSCMDLFNLFYAVLNAKTEISEELIKKGGDLAEQQPRRSLFPDYTRLVYYPYQAATQTEKEKKNLNLNTKHKGKQKPYLKENRGCWSFELGGRKPYLESAFNLV
ncbi:hypothetical protein CFP56_024377 [Quercus suber]|uniref:Uncharacterized protein n=1 Tax=Quercus suber TaxID=58331 RepID=A0AAW0MB68_QUESU